MHIMGCVRRALEQQTLRNAMGGVSDGAMMWACWHVAWYSLATKKTKKVNGRA